MIIFKYWQPILAALITAVMAYGIHGCSMRNAENDKNKALNEQKIKLEQQCNKLQEITENASKNYQIGLSSLDRDFNSVMRQQACVRIIDSGKASGRPDAADKPKQPGSGNEVNSGLLFSFSKQCEIDRLKVIGLQKFINDERN